MIDLAIKMYHLECIVESVIRSIIIINIKSKLSVAVCMNEFFYFHTLTTSQIKFNICGCYSSCNNALSHTTLQH